MKSLFFVGVGVAIGFLLARAVAQTSGGSAFVSGIDSQTKAFADAIASGYRAREAELRRHRTA